MSKSSNSWLLSQEETAEILRRVQRDAEPKACTREDEWDEPWDEEQMLLDQQTYYYFS